MTNPTALVHLIERLDEFDHELLTVSQEQLDITQDRLPKTVTALSDYMGALESRELFLREKIAQLRSLADAFKSKREHIKKFVGSRMHELGFEKLPGDNCMAYIRTSEVCETDSVEFTPEFLGKYSQYVKTKHELSVSAIKKDLQTGEFHIPFGHIRKNYHLDFSYRKDK